MNLNSKHLWDEKFCGAPGDPKIILPRFFPDLFNDTKRQKMTNDGVGYLASTLIVDMLARTLPVNK